MKHTFAIKTLSAAVAYILCNQIAVAQIDPALNAQSLQSSDQEVEKISVTGSRIKRYEFSLPTPMVVIGRDELDDIGSPDITDALLQIPSVVAGVTDASSTAGIQRNGIQSIDLRNLGDNRTLTLIDGRRTVSNSGNANRVSQSDFPSSFIQSAEVVTGGKSSVYGSDAVAGVVNLITVKNKEGITIDISSRRSDDLDRNSQSFEVNYGTKFDNDKGYIFAALDFDTRAASRSRNIKRTTIQADWDYDDGKNEFSNKLGVDIPANEITPDEYGNLSADPEGGRFDGSNFWYDENGLREDFVTDRDGFDFRYDDTFQSPRDRLNIGIKGSYEFANDTEGFFTIIRSNTKTNNVREAEGDDYNDTHLLIAADGTLEDTITAGRIPIDNPYAPQIIIDNESSSGIRWDRRFSDVGTQNTVNDRTTTRVWAGVKGVMLDEWDWEVSVGYGKFVQDQRRTNEINIINLRKGLNAERLEDGTIQCADADDRAAGCVPVNLFGRGSITPEAADYIRANLDLKVEVEQVNFQAFMSGELFELPAGPIAAAFGVEYREDEQDIQPNELNQRGGHTSGHVPAFGGSIAVGEVFGELYFPLLEDAPLAHNLSAETSVRVANYDIDKVGTIVSFGVGLQWAPIDSLNFRANFGRALRAPDLTELFSPPRGDADSVNDVCDGVQVGDVSVIAQNCLSEPGIIAAINNPDSETPGVFEDTGESTSSPNSGNPNLKEEESDTITIGFVWQPTNIKGLSLSADYYSIEIEDAIDALSNEQILNRCYDDPSNFGPENSFCADITRNPEDGQIDNMVQRQFNLNGVETSGIDYMFNYAFELDSWGLPGSLDITYNHTHIIKLQTIIDDDIELKQIENLAAGVPGTDSVAADGRLDGLNFDNDRGEQVSESFTDRGRLTISWSNDDWRVSAGANYYGSTIDSYELRQTYLDAIEEFGNDAEEPLYLNFDSEIFYNLSASYSTEVKGYSVKFYGGINNILNNNGPFVPGGDTLSGNSGNYADGYGLRGRSGYVRMKLNF